jgi:hypothetical protein
MEWMVVVALVSLVGALVVVAWEAGASDRNKPPAPPD